MEKKEKLPDTLLKAPFWGNPDHAIWLASCLVLHRNLSAFPFPKTLNDMQAVQILEAIVSALPPTYDTKNLFLLENLPPKQKELLFERFLLTEGFEKQSNGRGILSNETGSFLGMINFDDHLLLQCFTQETNLEEFYKTVEAFEKDLALKLTFSFSPRFGFLTTDPLIAGTGLVAQCFLHLPLLIQSGKLDDLLKTLNHDITTRGLGNEGEYIADLVLLENRYKIGVTEKDLLTSLSRSAKILAEAERSARQEVELLGEVLKDQIARAYGLLTNSLSIKTGEALSSLSLLHLAKELNWLQNCPQFHFFELFFDVRRSHLLLTHPNKEEEIPKFRAELLRQALTGTNLSMDLK